MCAFEVTMPAFLFCWQSFRNIYATEIGFPDEQSHFSPRGPCSQFGIILHSSNSRSKTFSLLVISFTALISCHFVVRRKYLGGWHIQLLSILYPRSMHWCMIRKELGECLQLGNRPAGTAVHAFSIKVLQTFKQKEKKPLSRCIIRNRNNTFFAVL